jgi:E3 ubiquitin-protein ligase MARCH6
MEVDAGPLPPHQLDECRICRDTSPPLRHPCLCRGSMRFVHEACLQQWLEHSRQGRRCEVCGIAFRWTPSYAPDTPTRLPLTDLAAGLLRRLGRVGRTTWRVLLSTLVWLCAVPLCTTWLWRLAFSQSLSAAGATLRWSWSHGSVVADCLGGTLLSACIVFVLLALASLRDTLRALGHEQRLLAGALRNAGFPQDGGHGPLGRVPDALALGPQLGDDGAGDGAADGGLWGAPGGDAPLGIQELIGVEGPVGALVENATTVLASNAIFLCVAIFLPFTVGRLALVAAHMGVSGTLAPGGAETAAAAGRAAASYRQSLVKAMTMQSPLSASLLASSNATEAGAAAAAAAVNGTLSATPSPWLAMLVNGTAASPSSWLGVLASLWAAQQQVDAPPSVGDVLTLLVGYALMAATATLWLCVVCAWHVRRSAHDGGVPLIVARQAMAAVLTTLVSAKVVFLLIIELGFFPLACGAWLGLCTLPLFGTSLRHRLAAAAAAPVAYCLLHWCAGIGYMLTVSGCVATMRQVLRPGLLAFLRDPADPGFDPFRDLVREPMHRHALRVVASCALYGVLIVACVWIPVALCAAAAPAGTLPLRFMLLDDSAMAVVELGLLRMVPPLVEQLNPTVQARVGLRAWFRVVGHLAGMTSYLLPGDNEHPPQAGGHDMHAAAAAAAAHARTFAPRTWFVPRVLAVLIAAWLTCVGLTLAAGFGPLAVGRLLFVAAGVSPDHDLGSYCLGLIALRAASLLAHGAVSAARNASAVIAANPQLVTARALVRGAARKCLDGCRAAASVVLALVVIPLLTGTLLGLVVSAPVNEGAAHLVRMNPHLGVASTKSQGELNPAVSLFTLLTGSSSSSSVSNSTLAAIPAVANATNATAAEVQGATGVQTAPAEAWNTCILLWWYGTLWLRSTYKLLLPAAQPEAGPGERRRGEAGMEVEQVHEAEPQAAAAPEQQAVAVPRWQEVLAQLTGAEALQALFRESTLKHLLLPAAGVLLAAMLVPWLAGYAACQAWGRGEAGSGACVAAVRDWGHPVVATLAACHLTLRWLRTRLVALHDAVRDERYLVGLALRDYQEVAAAAVDASVDSHEKQE